MVDAIGVSVVDIRERAVAVSLPIPSSSAAYDFVIRAIFRCKVTRPATVAAMGLTDVTAPLANHLRADVELMRLGTQRRVEEVNEVRQHVIARVTAYCEFHVPRIDGMNIALVSVDVIVPADHRKHAADMIAEERRQELLAFAHAFENRDVDRLAQIIARGPDVLSALSISRGEIPAWQVAERVYADAEAKLNAMIALVQKLPEGALDFVSVDAKSLIEEVLTRVVGPRPATGVLAAANGHGARSEQESPPDALDEVPPPLDEDDTVD